MNERGKEVGPTGRTGFESWALTEIIGPCPMVMGDPDPLRGALQKWWVGIWSPDPLSHAGQSTMKPT